MIALKYGYLFFSACVAYISPCIHLLSYCCGVSCEQRPLPVVYSGVDSLELVNAIFGVPLGRRWSAHLTSEPSRGEYSNVSFGLTVLDQLLVVVLSERILSSAKGC